MTFVAPLRMGVYVLRLLSTLMLACGLTAANASAGAAVPRLTITLSANRLSYFVGEPVGLTVRIKNDGDAPVKTFVGISPPKNEIYYRRGDGPPRSLSPYRYEKARKRLLLDEIRLLQLPTRVKAGEELTDPPAILVLDPESEEWIFGQPGDYDFWVVCHPSAGDPPFELKSNVVTVQVEEPPAAHRAAFEAYRAGQLARVIDSPMSFATDKEMVKTAQDFLAQYPSGPYSEPLQVAFIHLLGQRARDGHATREEQDLLARLKGGDGRE